MRRLLLLFGLIAVPCPAGAQQPPYDVFPSAEPPYYRVRYEASTRPGTLAFAANYTIWLPPGVRTLRGVIVHQHGCGEGSCKSGLTGAYDLHWQALARRHRCALLATVPAQARNPYGRPVFQNLQYSDTPPQPIAPCRYRDTTADAAQPHLYRVIAVNTVGLTSR